MKERIRELVTKAKRSLKAAKRLLAHGDFDFSTSRAYYAMFYLAEGMLLTQGKAFSSHRGVITEFGKTFAKTRIVAPDLHKWLSTAFASRQKSDYWPGVEITKREAAEVIKRAEQFVRICIDYLKQHSDYKE